MQDNETEAASKLKDTCSVLKSEWTQRSSSARARFYIASHPGWQDSKKWTEQARIDASFVLLGLNEAQCTDMNVLEIGCGNGRLVPFIASRVKTYTGIDICRNFVDECKNRLGETRTIRFVENNGSDLPESICDRHYGLVFAAAVFIHCPFNVIASYLVSIRQVAKRPTVLRFQVLTDPKDLSDIIPVESLDPEAYERSKNCHDVVVKEQDAAQEHDLVEESSYQGHLFRMDELRSFLADLFGDSAIVNLIRFDPLIANCEVLL